ncbi:hypothetical protein [Pseudomonas sp. NPDC089547]|uniref:hypothetical protein n=1 Tax=Pseudomonas sp. NPDC089547 TaxID=3390652 RepID=UPI003D045646
MSEVLELTAEARAWAKSAMARLESRSFGELVCGVIWTDKKNEAGELLVPADPDHLVNKFTKHPHILLHNHDPGRPKGQVLDCAIFVTPEGRRFIAAILGYYAGGEVSSFRDYGLTELSFSEPLTLPELPTEAFIQVATDPREVDESWVDSIAVDAPVPFYRTELSNNAAVPDQELIRVGLAFLALVWNPFVTSIATEAGKSAYSGMHSWVRRLIEKVAERRAPILDFHTHQYGCQISFILRGRDLQKHYKAHETLPAAAAQAAALVLKLKSKGPGARQLIYEFDQNALRWVPSFAVLNDNRIVTDNLALLSIEQLPSGLSLGLTRGKQLFTGEPPKESP